VRQHVDDGRPHIDMVVKPAALRTSPSRVATGAAVQSIGGVAKPVWRA